MNVNLSKRGISYKDISKQLDFMYGHFLNNSDKSLLFRVLDSD